MVDSVANGGNTPSPSPPKQLTPESRSLFVEGISLVLSRWTALQMAIQNEWGGRDSRQKSDQLASDILSWFSKTKEPLYIDDLEDMLFENMALLFNIKLEDGSEEEVAEQLMIIQEECLQGNYESIKKLRVSKNGAQAVSQSRQLVNEDDDESSEDEEASDMVVDEQTQRSNSKTEDTSVDEQRPVEAEDGWCVVPSRRNRGNRRH
ncbi:Pre-rRNA-processing protein TSR2 [Macleaya cordata]|uniref:Pre-rRNA-processing protein TSR2 n=1 Tax=Macleaya cordata TaxID=56857 RepID=A0A200Q4W6_MACCD|nr:Pre-rRNA-processing protein TSR2 [Macleaya cordata]